MQAHRRVTPSLYSSPRLLRTSLAVAALAYAVVALVMRARPLTRFLGLVVAVGTPYIPLVAAFGFVMAALSRRVVLAILTVAIAVITVAAQVPWYYLGHPADVGQHVDIRVLSSNLRKGQADPSSFVRLATQSADVITVAELTSEEARHFSEAGIDDAFPYSVLIPKPGAGGIGLWSRFPLSAVSPTENPHTATAVARLRVPGVRFDPLVASVHITSPVAPVAHPFSRWRIGIANMKANLASFADTAGPGAVIVAGDFNSTPDLYQFRDLLADGYRDAVEQTGAGFAPTYPSDPWLPPLITIDHVLTRQAAAASIRTVVVAGSDHRALLATVEIPLDPTAS